MKLQQDIRPITYLKTRAADLIRQVNETRRHVVITHNGNARAVLLDPESYQQMRDSISLLALIARGEDDVRDRKTEEQGALFARIRRQLEDQEDPDHSG